MPLSDFACKNAKPKDRPYRLADGDGLYLLVQKKRLETLATASSS